MNKLELFAKLGDNKQNDLHKSCSINNNKSKLNKKKKKRIKRRRIENFECFKNFLEAMSVCYFFRVVVAILAKKEQVLLMILEGHCENDVTFHHTMRIENGRFNDKLMLVACKVKERVTSHIKSNTIERV